LLTARATVGSGFVIATSGLITGSAAVTLVLNNTPPTILTPLTNTTAVMNVPKAFTCTATDPDKDPLRYTWSFGDGSALVVGQNVSHTYAKPGVFLYAVHVDDLSGLAGHNVSSSAYVTVPFVIQLSAGWNLVSIPVQSATPYMASKLGLSTADEVFGWNSATQTYGSMFIVGVTPLLLDFALQPNLGYWIFSVNAKTISIVGNLPTTPQSVSFTVPATGGYVLVGYCSMNSTWTAATMATWFTGGRPTTLANWNPTTQTFSFYLVGVPTVAFPLVPGHAYWVYVTASVTMSYTP
jgi:hypothetical protein